VTARTACRTAATVAGTALLMTVASPAWAEFYDDGEQPGPGLGPIETLLLYVGAPAALFLLIALLVMAPSMARGPRYRPGLGWWAAPVWFNGPAEGQVEEAVRTAVPTAEGGGASARW
jgi:hypothetical protein